MRIAWDFLPYIDLSITSHEVGREKPNQLIFERALERAGARPERAVHVGDQITSDIAGAVNAGINAVLLDRMATQGLYGTAANHWARGASGAAGAISVLGVLPKVIYMCGGQTGRIVACGILLIRTHNG